MDLHGESGFIRGKWNHPLDFHHLSWAAHPQGWWGGGGWGSAGVREPEAAPSEEPTRLGGFLTTYFAIHISLPTPSKPAGLCLLARGACQGPFLRCRGRMLELIKIRVGAESCLKPAPARGGGGNGGRARLWATMTTRFGTRTLLPTLLPALLPPRLLIPAPQPRPGRQPSPAQFGSLNTSSRAIIKKK